MSLYNESLSVLTLTPAVRLASANGTTVDRVPSGNAYEQALVVVMAGTITDGTQTVVIQESDDGATWTNVPAGRLSATPGALAPGQSNSVTDFGVYSQRRYLRVNVTVGGAPATGGVVGVAIVLLDPSYIPAR